MGLKVWGSRGVEGGMWVGCGGVGGVVQSLSSPESLQ